MAKSGVSKKGKTLKFKYIFDNGYNAKYANGAYGGVTPRGEITINFYYERSPIPHDQIHNLTDDGRVGEIVETNPIDHTTTLVRVVETGIILNVQTAKDIIQWLQNKIDVIELVKQGKDGINSK